VDKPLNERQKRFANIYCGNATVAARGAGYTGSDAALAVTGARLLRNTKVAELIFDRQNSSLCIQIANRRQRQIFWTAVMTDESQRMKDRLKASELLAKSEGDFIIRVQNNFVEGLAERLAAARTRVARMREQKKTC